MGWLGCFGTTREFTVISESFVDNFAKFTENIPPMVLFAGLFLFVHYSEQLFYKVTVKSGYRGDFCSSTVYLEKTEHKKTFVFCRS